MKKLLACALALTLLLGCASVLALTFSAVGSYELPFTLKAPPTVAVEKIDGDSPTTMKFVYSMDNEMAEWLRRRETFNGEGDFFAQYPFDDLWVHIQIDWAVDDVKDPVSGWHYNEYWDGHPYYSWGHDDEDHCRVSDWDVVDAWIGSSDTVNDVWVTRGVPNDERWYGNPETGTPGVRDQLRPDQYTYDEENEELRIDFTQHTMYFRARFVVTVRTESDEVTDDYFFSDWSETVAWGKDAASTEIDLSAIKAPVVTGLRMTDDEFNGAPIVAFTLTVPDELSRNLTLLEAKGGTVWIEVEARLNKEGAEWVELQGDWTVKPGEMTAALQNLAEHEGGIEQDAEILLRTRYWVQTPEEEEFRTDWSNVITFGSDKVELATEAPLADATPAMGEEDEVTETKTGCSCSCGGAAAFIALIPLLAAAAARFFFKG